MFAIRLDVNGEIFVTLWIGEAVVGPQSIDLRFTDGRDLTLVGVKSCESFGCRSVATNRSERVDQVLRLGFFCRVASLDIGNAEALSKLQPHLRMIRRACFLIDQVVQ